MQMHPGVPLSFVFAPVNIESGLQAEPAPGRLRNHNFHALDGRATPAILSGNDHSLAATRE